MLIIKFDRKNFNLLLIIDIGIECLFCSLGGRHMIMTCSLQEGNIQMRLFSNHIMLFVSQSLPSSMSIHGHPTKILIGF